MRKWHVCLIAIQRWFVLDHDVIPAEKYSLEQMAQEACAELKQAHELLNWVTEPDMVEYAVYTLKAAEKRYDYMIKKIREQEAAAPQNLKPDYRTAVF